MSDEDLTAKNDSPHYDGERDDEFAALVASMQSGAFAPNVADRLYWIVLAKVVIMKTPDEDDNVAGAQGVVLGGLFSNEENAKAAATSVGLGIRQANPDCMVEIETSIIQLPLDVIPHTDMHSVEDI